MVFLYDIIKFLFIFDILSNSEKGDYITLTDYTDKALNVINKELKLNEKETIKVKDILVNIYEEMKPVNKNLLALFTGAALYNTNFFRQFKKDKDGDKYCPRGLLSISEKRGYERISKVTQINFIDNPELLEEYNLDTIKHTVKYFRDIMDLEEYTFIGMMKGLYFSKYCKYTIDGYLTDDWLRQESLYNKLKDEY